jgi:hypothetical protein
MNQKRFTVRHFLIFNATSPAYPGSNQKGDKRQRLKIEEEQPSATLLYKERAVFPPLAILGDEGDRKVKS